MPTPTYTPLANLTLGSAASTVSFSSIPAGYRDVVLVSSFVLSSASNAVGIQFNGDTGTNYSVVIMSGNGSSAQSSTEPGTNDKIRVAGRYVGPQTAVGDILIQTMDYSATDKHKTVLARYGGADAEVMATAGRWANTAAVTSIRIFPFGINFNAGTTFALYGIAS